MVHVVVNSRPQLSTAQQLDIVVYFFFLRKDVLVICISLTAYMGFPGGSGVKNLSAIQETQVQSLGQEGPLEKGMAAHSVLLGKSHRQRNLAGHSPWGHKESDTTGHADTHTPYAVLGIY